MLLTGWATGQGAWAITPCHRGDCLGHASSPAGTATDSQHPLFRLGPALVSVSSMTHVRQANRHNQGAQSS